MSVRFLHSAQLSESNILENLKKLQDALSLQDLELCEQMGLSMEKYRRVMAGKVACPFESLVTLADGLDVSFDLLVKSRLDLFSLSRARSGDVNALPAIYEHPERSFSRVRSTQIVLDYLSLMRGYDFSRRIRRSLQLPFSSLADSSKLIDSSVNIDLLRSLRREGFSDDEYLQMGGLYLPALRNSPIYGHLKEIALPDHFYETLVRNYLPELERLVEYRILSLDSNSCTLEVRPREEVKSAFHSDVVGIRESCLFRQGTLSGFLGVIRNYKSSIEESECLYLGGKACVYHLSWLE